MASLALRAERRETLYLSRAPALHLLTDEVAAHLQNYVAGGGTLVVTPRTGAKDAANVVMNQPLPGLLAEVCGVIVEEYDAISPASP